MDNPPFSSSTCDRVPYRYFGPTFDSRSLGISGLYYSTKREAALPVLGKTADYWLRENSAQRLVRDRVKGVGNFVE